MTTNPRPADLQRLVADAVDRVEPTFEATWRPANPVMLTAAEMASLIDHTALKADTTSTQIDRLCAEASAYGFASVCVNPTWVSRCADLLSGSSSRVCTVVGFPLGAMLTESKVGETQDVIAAGATEVDMVINVGWLKDGAYMRLYDDIRAVAEAAHAGSALVKVILETCLLTSEEKVAASVIAQSAGVDFIKTSTGFNSGGATLPDVALMRAAVGLELGIKAAGGIKSAEDVRFMVAAGATRIGASAGVAIMESLSTTVGLADVAGELD